MPRDPKRPTHLAPPGPWARGLGAFGAALWGAALLVAATGCIETEPAGLSLSWSFPDGQSCQDAGVLEVEVELSASTAADARFPCSDGLAPREVQLGAFEPGLVVLRVRALSPDGVVTFSAEGRSPVDEGEQSISITLEAAGAD